MCTQVLEKWRTSFKVNHFLELLPQVPIINTFVLHLRTSCLHFLIKILTLNTVANARNAPINALIIIINILKKGNKADTINWWKYCELLRLNHFGLCVSWRLVYFEVGGRTNVMLTQRRAD